MKALLFLFMVCSLSLEAQDCKCVYNHYDSTLAAPAKVFSFSKNRTIGMYGEYYAEGKDTTYSEIILCLCGQKKIILDRSDDPTISFKVRKRKDTLWIEEIAGLPIGKDYEIVWKPFYVQKFFFNKEELQHAGYYRKEVKRFTDKQIEEVLKQYKKIKTGNADYTIAVAYRLFWATVSGNKKAEALLSSIPAKFNGLDGAYAQEWHEIMATLNHWKSWKTLNKK